MSWIEGIGDEVTITVGIGLILLLLMAAWLSTGTRDIPFISVIVVHLRRRRVLREQAAASEAEADTSEPVESVQAGFESSVENVPTSNTFTQPSGTSVDSNTNADPSVGTDDSRSNGINQTNKQTDSTDTSDDGNNQNINSDNTAQTSEQEKCTCGVDITVPQNETELRQKRINFLSSKTEQSAPISSLSTANHKCPVHDKDTCRSNTETQSVNHDSHEPSEPTSNSIPVPSNSNRNSVSQESGENRNDAGNRTTGDINADADSEIRVRIKFLNDTQRLVTSPATETVGNFRRRHFSDELSESKLVRFIFNGQVLQNDASTLQSYNISDNSVLHCLVTQQQQQQQQQQTHDDFGFNIGILMFPLFGLLLAVIWYLRFTYRQFFNVTSTLTLAGITFLYFAAFLSSLRTPVNHEHID